MKKFIDILLFSLLFFLIFSYFAGSNNTPVSRGIVFETSKTSYTVPSSIDLKIINNTVENIAFDLCEDMSVRYSGTIIDLPQEFCGQRSLNPTQEISLNFDKYHTMFDAPGGYIFEFNLSDQKFIQQFEVVYRGTLGKLFTGLLYAPMYNLLAFLISFFSNSLGWAIVVLTIIIRIILLFPQHKMMVGQRKMQAIQPKIKKLQEKHKGNQQALGMELMKLYKDEGVNPMGSCGFLLIQMPILLVIYNIILNITSLTNDFYLYEGLKDFKISQIDFSFFGIDLLAAGGVAGLVLAIIVAIIQYIQVKLSLYGRGDAPSSGLVLEKKKGESDYNSLMPDPEMMNKFMLYGMPVMVAIFTYTLIAGVGLYWGVSTLFAIFQQLFVNKATKK